MPNMNGNKKMLPGAIKDAQQISEDWQKIGEAIDGVSVARCAMFRATTASSPNLSS